jgi:hypothetical protein
VGVLAYASHQRDRLGDASAAATPAAICVAIEPAKGLLELRPGSRREGDGAASEDRLEGDDQPADIAAGMPGLRAPRARARA